MKIVSLWEKTVVDDFLNSELTEIVAEEVSQDAREKNEKIKQLESAVLAQRNSYLKLKKRREGLGKNLTLAERRVNELKGLVNDLSNKKINPSEITRKLKSILAKA